ncbi:MAG: serine/threonine protein kinase [Marmoricola sp.]|nr:serine/threonine protein kinase [Marmoricola sp.]
MGTGSIGPGTVLAGRYRLEDLLAESEGARFWRATDQILARSVAIHAVASDDPRASALLEAARVSATVVDPHLLRVLDCDDEDGISWVVNEWGDGVSLDLMLQQGTLPPSRAAWLAREVAEAIAAGHAQGVAHGRLNPEAVLVTHAGAVKLIGYVVDATLERPRPPDPLYGELDEREADVINLAGILYAALTGRWPGVARSAVPRAPRESRRPLRPRQVRAGVPRTLDAICERVLHKEGSMHAMPIETAQEIAAALADYVGDPALTAPVDAAAMHAEPAAPLHREEAGVADDPEATRVGAPPFAPELPVQDDPEATQGFRLSDDAPDSLSPLHAPADRTPSAAFPDLPERPLFASTERRVPTATRAGQQSGHGSGRSHASGPSEGGAGGHGDPADTGPGSAIGFWPFEEDPEEAAEVHTGKEGRGWLRVAVVVGVLLVLVVATAIAFNRSRTDGSTPSGTSSSPGGGPSSATSAAGAPVRLADVRDFDPFAQPPEENPETAPNAIDGDPATSWRTSTYRGSPGLGGLKAGVGLIVDLGKDVAAKSVTVRFKGRPTSFEVYAATAGVTQFPDSLDQLDKVGARADAPERATVTLDPAPTTRYVLVWLTKLPQVSGGYRGEISDVTVTS